MSGTETVDPVREAERGLLAAAIDDGAAYRRAAERGLLAEDFATAADSALWRAVGGFERAQGFLGAEQRERMEHIARWLAGEDDAAYARQVVALVEVLDAAPRLGLGEVAGAAVAVRDAARTRRAMQAGQDAVAALMAGVETPEDALRVLREAAVRVEREVAGTTTRQGQLLAEHMDATASSSDAVLARRAAGDERALSTPWPSLTGLLRGGGLLPGLHVIVGGTGAGKSQLALQFALHAAEQHGAAVRYAALELGLVDVRARLLSLACGGSPRWSDLWSGREHVPAAAQARLRGLPVHIGEMPPRGWSYEEIAEDAAAMRALYPSRPLVMVIDYAQVIGSPPDKREDQRERIAAAGYAARAVARAGATVLLLSSVAREHYAKLMAPDDWATSPPSEKDAAVLVGLGKESGDIEFAADTVLALATGPWVESAGRGTTWVAISKQRSGRPGWARLDFTGSVFAEPGGGKSLLDRR